MSTASSRSAPGQRSGSLLVIMGFLVAGILGLSLTAMISTLLIAQQTEGLAAAVNQSGTLRMQSYRIGMVMAAGRGSADAQPLAARRLAEGMLQRLSDPKLTNVIPALDTDPVRVAYDHVLQRWQHDLLPAVEQGAVKSYLGQVNDYVDDIHNLVGLIETRAEVYVDRLLTIQVFTLSLTVLAALLALVFLRAKILKPLQSLLDLAESARSGDFSMRTPYSGEDELGRLGNAMNLMSASLSELYGQLESRVAIKTRALEHSNRSLRLLYRSARSLDGSNLSSGMLHGVLADLHAELGLAAVRLCLHGSLDEGHENVPNGNPDDPVFPGGERQVTGSALQGVELCLGVDSEEANEMPFSGTEFASGANQDLALPTAVSFLIADQQTRYGMLWLLPDESKGLSGWQQPVLVSWCRQLATALNLRERMRESRRLAVHEERSILARELHDSLAQSLSYMKIQAMRLERILGQGQSDPAEKGADIAAETVLGDLRAGINSAYQHLRELLTSFRLKADEHGLHNALQATVAEFQAQGDILIECDDRLPPDLLTPNQEVHVLQIVREALANVRRHARASRARVQLQERSGQVLVEISDDGVGIGEVRHPWAHHGLSIMRERASSLGAKLDIGSNGQRGTLVQVRFTPRAHSVASNREPEQPTDPVDADN